MKTRNANTAKRLIAGATLAAATLGVAPLAASAQTYGYGYYPPAYGYRAGWYPRRAEGFIASVNGSDVTLRNGRQIFLHQGTVIQPLGVTLQPGMHIAVTGQPGGNGAVNADSVVVNAAPAYAPFYRGY